MSKQHIQQQAMRLFAEHGYEGASMQLVAEAVGIKKQSIYTHYRNKDELFLAACEEAMTQELTHAIAEINAMETVDALERYLYDTVQRYEARLETRFWLRMSIYPPMHLEARVMVHVYTYLDAVEAAVQQLLERQRDDLHERLPTDAMAQAYLGMIDACHIELLYGGPARVQKRIEASWLIFKRGVER